MADVRIPGTPSIPGSHYSKRAVKTQKERERIHKDSKFADQHKDLPFSFSKPKRSKAAPDICVCEKCGRESSINKKTCVLLVCPCGYLNRLGKESV